MGLFSVRCFVFKVDPKARTICPCLGRLVRIQDKDLQMIIRGLDDAITILQGIRDNARIPSENNVSIIF